MKNLMKAKLRLWEVVKAENSLSKINSIMIDFN